MNASPALSHVLVVNAGSSSLKFTVYSMLHEQVLVKGIVERIGQGRPSMNYERIADGLALKKSVQVANHDDAMRLVCDRLVDPQTGVLRNLAEVDAIGHRVVHGRDVFHDSVVVNAQVKATIRECFSIAPLHNPANLGGIEACERVFPDVPNIAVFDTAFHHTMPPWTYLYAIPYEYYEKYGIRKYGFHGTSHKFVSQATAQFLQRPIRELRLITAHIGNGASITAVDCGNVLDTSMGMTALNGLIMGTRSGDIDPAVVLLLVRKGMTADQIDNLLNKQSGLLGLSGISSGDMRDNIAAAEDGNLQARRAIRMFVHRLVSYIGAYFTILGGADALVFTGGVGENSAYIRALVLRQLACLNCFPDETANQAAIGKPAIISTPESRLQAIVMPTNEELMIARETVRLLTVHSGDAPINPEP